MTNALINGKMSKMKKLILPFNFLVLMMLPGIISGCDNDVNNVPDLGAPVPGPIIKSELNFTGIGIDYDPEVRCADNENTNEWIPGRTPAACNPQPSFTCQPGIDTLFDCPQRCQDCYDSDLNIIRNTLGVDAITIYQPNYYILKAAQLYGVKVIFGIFNDSVLGLSKSDSETDCTYAGSPLAFCGAEYANALLDGACFDTSPWSPETFCDKPGAFITAFDEFFEDGTVIGFQLGNEVLSTDIGLTNEKVVTAAGNVRASLNQRGYDHIPVIVSLVAGNEEHFCENGAPPANVDLIAAHPYCNFVASVPPSWPLNGDDCWSEVLQIYADTAEKFCGADNTYIGETGYNTGCPVTEGSAHIVDAETFIDNAVKWTCDNNKATFLFAFSDACPESGCLPGCSGDVPNVGNGYFGIYHTDGYHTTGSLVPKFNPLPVLSCN